MSDVKFDNIKDGLMHNISVIINTIKDELLERPQAQRSFEFIQLRIKNKLNTINELLNLSHEYS